MPDDFENDLIEELKDPEFAGKYGAECARSEFGLALLHARVAAKITQQDLAEKLGVRQPYIAQLESGEANPTLGMAGKIMAVLGLKMVIKVDRLSPHEKVVKYTQRRKAGAAFLAAGERKSTSLK
jgi:transcriptional regulator with XRE-family HTH domain